MIDNLIRSATCCISCGGEYGTGHLITDCYVLTARHCVISAIEFGEAIELTFPEPEGDISLPATIVAHSKEMDACILSVPKPLACSPIPLNAVMPREGDNWRSFGYPIEKIAIGHRVAGIISHLLDIPKLKMDIDLTVDPSNVLQSYKGFSGAAVVSENASRGMIRLKLDGTLGAISVQRLQKFLAENGIQMLQTGTNEDVSSESRGSLADRSEFQEAFEQMIVRNSGEYVFLEGAHGIGKTTFCNGFEPADRAMFPLGTYCLASQDRGPGAIFRAQPEIFFDWLSTKVSTLITGKPSRKEERSYATLVRETSVLLETFSDYCASTHQHGILFLDGLNEVQAVDPSVLAKFVGLLPQSLPQSVTIILTAPNYHGVAVSIAGRVKSQNIISLPPLSGDASSAYCWQELAKGRANPALVAQISEKAQGHPLYLRYLIEYANRSAEEDDLDDFPILTGSIEQYYESLWPRLLEDPDAINLLAIMARLRWGIGTSELLKILTSDEQRVFIPTTNRIRHLLLNPNTTTIYHPSFAVFLISKTVDLEMVIQERLADFCARESGLEYCVLNVIFHLLHSDDTRRSRAIVLCDQSWVDTCVTLGVEPDNLLFDIKLTLSAAVSLGPAVEVVRLLLLTQRVSFRYNTLFTQSARLIAEALIALKRPGEALKHAIRFNTLIVDPAESLQIAFRLIQHEYPAEALELLRLLYQRIREAHAFDKIELEDFVHLCKLNLRTVLFMRLADGNRRMLQIMNIVEYAKRVLKVTLTESPQESFEELFVRVECVLRAYFLSFADTYCGLTQLKEMGAQVPHSLFLLELSWALLECEEILERYNLPKDIASLSQLFSDIEELVTAGASLDKQFVPVIVNTLINFGAPASVVHLVADKIEALSPQHLKIRADNGVDVDFRSISQGVIGWRIFAFLDNDLACPIVGTFDEIGWLSSLDQLIRALYWCEGKARRAKADGDDSFQEQSLEFLKTRVLQSLAFTLAQRVKWKDSYAIPESIFPLLYGQVTMVLMDCYPIELPAFLRDLSKRAVDQCGLYSEGFREVMFAVLQKLMIYEIKPSFFDDVFGLLQQLKDRVIHGVENRHELVPELLKLIPLFVKMGAGEEAERLYRYMLSVSMGPTWYKEDQLGLMVEVLRNLPPSDNVQAVLPLVAGYLERASGEMTFQRFVRYEKEAFIGELFRRRRFVSGCRYFKRQTCGTTAELLLESQHGVIDKPNPTVGMRFPGGALDEQHAILEIVRNADELDWRLRWALLEIFQCGDERHKDDYASEYAKLVNQACIDSATISEMVRRMEFIVGAEIESAERSRFLRTFFKRLDISHHDAFSKIMAQFSNANSSDELAYPHEHVTYVASTSEDVDSRFEDKLYLPGVFGHRSAMSEADAELAIAETHLKLGNLKAAKNHAAKTLGILQEGGWSIWGNLSASSTRAEELLHEGPVTATEVIRFYGPLLETERYEAKWRLAEHLITKMVGLLSEDERNQLLHYVIDHVFVMVGDAKNEIVMFKFLGEEPQSNASVELFRFVLWLLDHPQWLRRDKAAGMAAWLVEMDPIYFEEAVKNAFSMTTGYSAEILCGILDGLSWKQPQQIWDRVFDLFNLESVLQSCKHVSRLAVLQRIAERAKNAGSSTGAEVASRVVELFRSGAIELGVSDTSFDLPSWANCLEHEWKMINQLGLVSRELIISFEEELAQICTPLDVQGDWSLEKKVSASFREPTNKWLNRWEAKVRFALNIAIFPYASKRNFREIEALLRVFNPSLPERTLTPGFDSPTEAIFNAISGGNDYTDVIGNSEFYFLNFNEIANRGDKGQWDYVEVIAVIVPSSSVRPGKFPSIKASFRSKQLPNFSSAIASNETCFRLEPEPAFFGSFTPAFHLPTFMALIKAKECDFIRINWRNGRSSDMWNLGRPVREGCLLAVKRTAVRLPEGKKMAWILLVNEELVAMVDSQNNKLV